MPHCTKKNLCLQLVSIERMLEFRSFFLYTLLFKRSIPREAEHGHTMLRFLAQRTVVLIPTFIGITLVTFLVVNLSPGGPQVVQDMNVREIGRAHV